MEIRLNAWENNKAISDLIDMSNFHLIDAILKGRGKKKYNIKTRRYANGKTDYVCVNLFLIVYNKTTHLAYSSKVLASSYG